MHKLTKHQEKLISSLIKSGRFNNRSEVVRAGLRLLEEHEAKVKTEAEGSAVTDRRGKKVAAKTSPPKPGEKDEVRGSGVAPKSSRAKP